MADIREKETPGVFNDIMQEMYQANNMPRVHFPPSVVSGYKSYKKRPTEKRDRDDDKEEEVGSMGAAALPVKKRRWGVWWQQLALNGSYGKTV